MIPIREGVVDNDMIYNFTNGMHQKIYSELPPDYQNYIRLTLQSDELEQTRNLTKGINNAPLKDIYDLVNKTGAAASSVSMKKRVNNLNKKISREIYNNRAKGRKEPGIPVHDTIYTSNFKGAHDPMHVLKAKYMNWNAP